MPQTNSASMPETALPGFHGRRGRGALLPTRVAMPSPNAISAQPAAATSRRAANTTVRMSTDSG